jgi:hypothetical protein
MSGFAFVICVADMTHRTGMGAVSETAAFAGAQPKGRYRDEKVLAFQGECRIISMSLGRLIVMGEMGDICIYRAACYQSE